MTTTEKAVTWASVIAVGVLLAPDPGPDQPCYGGVCGDAYHERY